MYKDLSNLCIFLKELRECGGRVFIDSPPEFGVPASNVVDYSQVEMRIYIDVIKNYKHIQSLTRNHIISASKTKFNFLHSRFFF